jgi:uncharacterized membrane protein
MRSCLCARPCPNVLMHLSPILPILFNSLNEPLMLLVCPTPVVVVLIRNVFVVLFLRGLISNRDTLFQTTRIYTTIALDLLLFTD